LPRINTSQVFNYAIAAVAVSILPIAAHAKQCDANGGVRFLGTGASGGQSVWISGTSAGAFRLEAAQGNQTVDTWSKNRRGLHVSLSPVVSSGNGGTHKLYSSDDCLLDTQNQKNGFVFPPNIIPPGISRPPLNRPLTPTVPGGVKPPIGALPTAPITPMVPGGVTPPIGALPVSPITPTVPGGVTPPIGALPEVPAPAGSKPELELSGPALARPYVPQQPCRGVRRDDESNTGIMSDCYTPAAEIQSGELPLTPGRELVAKEEWNIWLDTRVSRLHDQRDGMDTRGNASTISIGMDRTVSDDLVAGMQLSLSRATGNSFEGDMRTDSTSYSIGPYVSYSVSPNWLIYGAAGFGRQSVDTNILSLNGTSDSNQYSLNLQAEGQYALGSAVARPKFQLSHTYNSGDTYQLQGNILNTPITLNLQNASFNYGVAQSSVEINRVFEFGNNQLVMPYVEAGVYYEYARLQSGQHLTGNLTYADSSPWGGVLHAGARALFGKSTMASLEVGYQSLGITELSIWEFQLLVSHSF
jgi:hypothetical protein